ncbi:hypothetical protein ERC79_18090 [Rhodococcus sp. ABRD24]|uniref:hypothetical protein n=1 Tax=Rhodococcus sp. ABRD24 TaxID=2507582 RepID=UPI00103DD117|nr:hypothetical protein [Rhodococcus sp. ABRD24]QBJ97635.1 hypothetical protein ERC79_18090 [Rhodococcus sp. ABRD24]
MSTRDAMWSGSRILGVVGPVRLPSNDEIASRAAALIDAGRRCTPLGVMAGLHATDPVPVRALPQCGAGDLPLVLRQLAREPRDGPPLGLATAGNYLFVDLCHGLGDSRLMVLLTRALLDGPAAELPSWVRDREVSAPLARAVSTFYGSDPRRLRALLGVDRGRTDIDDHAPTRSWTRSPSVLVASASVGLADELRRWRDRWMSGTSLAAILCAAVSREVRARIPATDSTSVIFDCRRYLPESATVHGNFTAGVDLTLPDPGDPIEFGRGIGEALAAGRPLASLAHSVHRFRRAVRAGGRPGPATTVSCSPRARLVFSDVGQVIPLCSLDWVDGPGQRFAGVLSEPAEPESIVFTMLRRGPELDVTASLHDNVFDVDIVQDALDSALLDPLSLFPGRTP